MEPTELQLKTCIKCKVEKSISAFSKDKTTTDNLQNSCKECVKLYYKVNRLKMLERSKEYGNTYRKNNPSKPSKWYAENREKVLAQKKVYQAANADIIAEKKKLYLQTSSGKAAMHNSSSKRRALLEQGDATHKQVKELLELATNCFWCDVPLNKTIIHIDHFYPISKGGKHTISNLKVSCASCNQRKRDKMPEVFAEIIGKKLDELCSSMSINCHL